jgi:oxygen-dependent protoporphyrinogen oxidase
MARVIVVGGGMSGLSLAWRLRELRPDREVLVLEAGERAGGKARTVSAEGFLCETGVNGVLDNKPSTLGLAGRMGLEPLRSNDSSRRRFVIKNGRLAKLPEAPQEFLTSPLLSPLGRMRVILEAFTPKGDLSRDESLADFARRRLGKEAFGRLIDPMATGIYAGDPERLSLRSCFPRIYELERDYGGLIRAMIRLKREAKKKGAKGPGAGPGGTLTSFRGGMSELADALARSLGASLMLKRTAASVSRKGKGWSVALEDGEDLDATQVVLACPAREASRLLRESVPEVSRLAGRISYPPVSVVCFGIRQGSIGCSTDGFGFLAPGCERRRIMGTLWDSSIFPGRAPEGYSLLRSLVGGARAPETARLSDSDLTDVVIKELVGIMGLKGRPDFVRIFRWEEAIPQYEIGHQALVEGISDALGGSPGLHVRCNWVGGVSLNDCVANSERLAQELAAN